MKNLILLLFFFLPCYVFCQQNMVQIIAESPYIKSRKLTKNIPNLSDNKSMNLLDMHTDFILDSCYYILNKVTDEYTLYSKYPINEDNVGFSFYREYLYLDKINTKAFVIRFLDVIEDGEIRKNRIKMKRREDPITNDYLFGIYEMMLSYPYVPYLFLYYRNAFVITEEPQEYENGSFGFIEIYPTPDDYPNHPYNIDIDIYAKFSMDKDIMHNIYDISHERFLEILENIKNKAKEYGIKPFRKN